MRRPRLLLLLAASASFLHAADDDLFTGTPKDEFEKRADKFSARQWGVVVAASDAEPLKIPASARMRADFDRDFLGWMREKMAKPAQAEVRGDPAEQRLVALVDAAVTRMTTGLGNAASFIPDATAIAQGDQRRPFLDYFAEYLLYGRKEDLAVKLNRGIAGAEAIPGPLRLAAQARVLAYELTFEKEKAPAAQDRYEEIFQKDTATPIAEADAPFLLRIYHTAPLPRARMGREAWHLERIAQAKWPEWMRLTLVGELESQLGWQARGSGWAKDVPEEQRRDFREHMLKARTALVRAWELKPELPWAACEMIGIVKGGVAERGETTRVWLERTIAAEVDHDSAWDTMFQALQPRWGGSYEAMLALGRSCALTERFDTEIPTLFNQAVFEMGQDVGHWQSLYRHPDVARLLIATRQQRLEKAGDPMVEFQQRSLLFLERSLIGDPKGAAEELPHLVGADGGMRADPQMLDWATKLGFDYVQAWADADFAASDLAADWGKAAGLTAEGKHQEAAALLKTMQPQAKNNMTKAALAARLDVEQFQIKFADGAWHHLPVNSRLDFNVVEGDHLWEQDQNRLRLGNHGNYGREFFRGTLGTHFELRGKWEFSRNGSFRGGVAFFFGPSSEPWSIQVPHWWSLRVSGVKEDQNVADFVQRWDPPRGVGYFAEKPGAEFVLRRDGEKVVLTVEGEEILTAKLPADASSEAGTFGFGALGGGPRGYVELWDLQARQLAKE